MRLLLLVATQPRLRAVPALPPGRPLLFAFAFAAAAAAGAQWGTLRPTICGRGVARCGERCWSSNAPVVEKSLLHSPCRYWIVRNSWGTYWVRRWGSYLGAACCCLLRHSVAVPVAPLAWRGEPAGLQTVQLATFLLPGDLPPISCMARPPCRCRATWASSSCSAA